MAAEAWRETTSGPIENGTVVVVFLRGGADGLTLVPPVGDDGYYRERPQLAVPRAEAVPLDGFFALHPALRPLLPLFADGLLTVVPACGSDDDTRSHFEAQDLMEQGGRGRGGGFLGRFLRTAGASGPLSGVAFGSALPLSLLGAPGAIALRTVEELSLGDSEAALLGPLQRLYEGEAILGPSAHAALRALRTLGRLRRQPDRPPASAAYADDDLSRGLRLIARLIKEDLGLRAATLDLPGWDSHVLQAQVMEPLMRSLAAGLSAFARDLGRRLAHTGPGDDRVRPARGRELRPGHRPRPGQRPLRPGRRRPGRRPGPLARPRPLRPRRPRRRGRRQRLPRGGGRGPPPPRRARRRAVSVVVRRASRCGHRRCALAYRGCGGEDDRGSR